MFKYEEDKNGNKLMSWIRKLFNKSYDDGYLDMYGKTYVMMTKIEFMADNDSIEGIKELCEEFHGGTFEESIKGEVK